MDTADTDTFPEIPDLALLYFFKKLNYEDQRNCAQVCWKWRNLIDRHIGKIVHVKKQLGEDHDPYFEDIGVISTIGVSECYVFGDIGEDIPNFKYPHLVKSIIFFDSSLTVNKFNHLVKDLTNLQKLSLHGGFMNSGFEARVMSLRFEKLKTFVLVYEDKEEYEDEQLIFRPDKNTVKNIIGLLDGIFSPRLELLILELPCFPEMELYLLDYLFKCIVRHKLTLKALELKFLNMDIQIDEEGLISLLGPLPSSVLLSDIPHLNLRTININSEEYDGTEMIDHYLKDHLFSRLTTLRFYKDTQYYESFSLPTQMIMNNSNTLVSINLNCHGEMDSLIDCSVFSQCSSLKSLTLATGYWTLDDHLEDYDPGRVIGLMSLPKSLEFIQLTFISTTTEDLTSLALELPNLKSLLLVDTVDEFGGILGASVVIEILTRKQIMQIIVRNEGMDVSKDWISTLKCFEESQPLIKNILEDMKKYKSYFALHLQDGIYKMGLLPKENIFASFGAMVPFQHQDHFGNRPPYYPSGVSRVWHKLISAVKRVRNRVYQFLSWN